MARSQEVFFSISQHKPLIEEAQGDLRKFIEKKELAPVIYNVNQSLHRLTNIYGMPPEGQFAAFAQTHTQDIVYDLQSYRKLPITDEQVTLAIDYLSNLSRTYQTIISAIAPTYAHIITRSLDKIIWERLVNFTIYRNPEDIAEQTHSYIMSLIILTDFWETHKAEDIQRPVHESHGQVAYGDPEDSNNEIEAFEYEDVITSLPPIDAEVIKALLVGYTEHEILTQGLYIRDSGRRNLVHITQQDIIHAKKELLKDLEREDQIKVAEIQDPVGQTETYLYLREKDILTDLYVAVADVSLQEIWWTIEHASLTYEEKTALVKEINYFKESEERREFEMNQHITRSQFLRNLQAAVLKVDRVLQTTNAKIMEGIPTTPIHKQLAEIEQQTTEKTYGQRMKYPKSFIEKIDWLRRIIKSDPGKINLIANTKYQAIINYLMTTNEDFTNDTLAERLNVPFYLSSDAITRSLDRLLNPLPYYITKSLIPRDSNMFQLLLLVPNEGQLKQLEITRPIDYDLYKFLVTPNKDGLYPTPKEALDQFGLPDEPMHHRRIADLVTFFTTGEIKQAKPHNLLKQLATIWNCSEASAREQLKLKVQQEHIDAVAKQYGVSKKTIWRLINDIHQ